MANSLITQSLNIENYENILGIWRRSQYFANYLSKSAKTGSIILHHLPFLLQNKLHKKS